MLRRLILLPVVIAAALTAGCGDDTTSAPTTDPPVIVTETFSGTVTVNGAFSHPFAVARAGTVTAEITALSPDDTVVVGLALGTWNGITCQVVIANDAAKLASAVIGTATASGSLCVRVFDVGGLSAPANYDIKVDHY